MKTIIALRAERCLACRRFSRLAISSASQRVSCAIGIHRVELYRPDLGHSAHEGHPTMGIESLDQGMEECPHA